MQAPPPTRCPSAPGIAQRILAPRFRERTGALGAPCLALAGGKTLRQVALLLRRGDAGAPAASASAAHPAQSRHSGASLLAWTEEQSIIAQRVTCNSSPYAGVSSQEPPTSLTISTRGQADGKVDGTSSLRSFHRYRGGQARRDYGTDSVTNEPSSVQPGSPPRPILNAFFLPRGLLGRLGGRLMLSWPAAAAGDR